MARLVILRHEAPDTARGLHWDLMLEAENTLWTWVFPAEPQPGSELRGERIADHRVLYLTYEGPVSGHRGHVTRRFASEFAWLLQTEQRIVVQLRGDGGQLQLDRVDPLNGGWQVRWLPHPSRSCHRITPPPTARHQ